MILCSKLKNGPCKIVTKSQDVTKSSLHCTSNSEKNVQNKKSSTCENLRGSDFVHCFEDETKLKSPFEIKQPLIYFLVSFFVDAKHLPCLKKD